MSAPEDRLPYPGLRAYHLDESDLFFGREGCVEEMIGRLAATRFLAVLGASGSGKSSLVRTGLIDGLELGLLAKAGSRWLIADCHPGGQPMRNLAAALNEVRTSLGHQSLETDLLASYLRRGPRSLTAWCEDGNLPPRTSLLLLVDQFEELFRYGDYDSREEAEAFASLLLESARGAAPIYVVITMRSEYLGACALIPGLAEAINAGLYLTRRMTREECREAIVGPASVTGFDIEPRLVTRLLNDLSSFAPWDADANGSQLHRLSRRADQLPLMQHVLSRLWMQAKERATEGKRLTLTLADYERIGELRGALDAHAEAVANRLSGSAEALLGPVFRALVVGTSISDAVRRPRTLADLVAVTGERREVIVKIVEAFRAPDCNFLRPPAATPLTDATVIDISHESLIRQWSSLGRWLSDEARAAALWQQLVNAQTRHERGEGDLLHGLDLDNVLAWWERERPNAAWAAAYGGDVAAAAAFLETCRRERDREQEIKKASERRARRRLKLLAASFAGLFALAAASSVYAWRTNETLRVEEERARAAAREAELAAERATEARKTAEAAQAAADNANTMALRATDQFVTDLADRLRRMNGVPPEATLQLLGDGERFVADLAPHMSEQAAIARTRAQLALAAGKMAREQGQRDSAQKALAAAREALAAIGSGTSPVVEDTLLLAATYRLESRLFEEAGAFVDAEASARSGHKLVMEATLAAEPGARLERAEANYALGRALTFTDKYDEAIRWSTACVEELQVNEAAPADADQRLLLSRCHTLISHSFSKKNDTVEMAKHSAKALAALADLPPSAKTLEIIVAEAVARGNISWEKEVSGDTDAARKGYEEVVDLLRPVVQNSPWSANIRYQYSFYLRSAGRLADKQGDVDVAYEKLRISVAESRTLLQQAKVNVSFTEHAQSVLVDFVEQIKKKPGWERNIAYLDDLLRSLTQERELEATYADQWVTWCQACALWTDQQIAEVMAKRMRNLNEDRYDELRQLITRIENDARRVIDAPPEPRYSINALRSWLWSINYLPDQPEDMPSVTDDVTLLERLEASRQSFRDYLTRFPQAWMIEDKLGIVSTSLARLYARFGRKEDAVLAAEAGAAAYSKEAVELLVDWYGTGSGPVSRDEIKANQYRSQLTSRNWSMKRFTVNSDFLWTKENDKLGYNIYIKDPRDDQDNSFTRTVRQLEELEGVRLPSEVVDSFNKLQIIARENNVSFVDLAVYALGEQSGSSTVDKLANKLGSELRGSDQSVAVESVVNMVVVELGQSGDEAVAGALKQIALEANSRESAEPLMLVAGRLRRAGHGTAAVAIYDGLLSATGQSAAELARLYHGRARARLLAGDNAGGEQDLLMAATLAPSDPAILNSLGYIWTDVDQRLPAAIDLLKRATAQAPDNPFIKDSLGWAYVRLGETEKGLALLQAAAAAEPGVPEILAHLADAHRRLGQTEEAQRLFQQALGLAPDEKVTAFIRRQQALLNESAG